MAWWSEVLWSRFSVTTDGAQYLQEFSLISHGHLNALNTIQNHAAIRDHFSLILWPLSLLNWLWPHGLIMLWAQDAALVVAEMIAFAWMVHLVRTHPRSLDTGRGNTVLVCGLAVLVLNPWTYWSMSFDLHIEPLAIPFALAAAFDFSRGRRWRAWLWVGLLLSFGDVTATWVVGLGFSALLAAYFDRGQHHVRTAALLAVVGGAWLELIGALGANESSIITGLYGYLVGPAGAPSPANITAGDVVRGLIEHPQRFVAHVWTHRLNILANTAPAGVVGIFTPWTIGVPLAVILVNNSVEFSNGLFTNPGFQSMPIYDFGAVGIVICLAALLTWERWQFPRIGRVLAAVVTVNALAWAVVWVPAVGAAWLRISPAQARVLSDIERQIPNGDEVVASQGVVGRFAARSDVVTLQASGKFLVKGQIVWFVLDSLSGLETVPVDGMSAFIGQLAGPLHATLEDHAQGIWAFRWQRPATVHTLHIPTQPSSVPGWTADGASGKEMLSGPASDWNTEATRGQGYVVARDYWLRPDGHYEATVNLSGSSGLSFEVWDDNENHFVARQFLPASQGRESFTLPFAVTSKHPGVAPYSGWGPFHLNPSASASGQVLEIRLFAHAGSTAHVYRLSITKR
ncbi:MAG TPA: DUF2079 domain-containing protein [Acidimicrobiales bacterium]|jgi:hypothetical protein|nr:DUF2079 domain-containing protein [Acidimicrobiales bacterium]